MPMDGFGDSPREGRAEAGGRLGRGVPGSRPAVEGRAERPASEGRAERVGAAWANTELRGCCAGCRSKAPG